MKTNFFLAAGMLIAAIATGQNRELIEIEVKPPVFKGDEPGTISDFLQKYVEYPEESRQWKLQGTEVVQFVVTIQGELSNFKVINSVSPGIDREVIRLLELTNGIWIPGTINGEPAAMEKEVSLAFKLSPASDFVEKAKWNMKKGNELLFLKDQPGKALKYFNMAVNFLPNDDAIHGIRGFCKYRMGDENGANRDWDRANILADRKGNVIDFEKLAKSAVKQQELEKILLSVEK
ncbi:MAG: outer membrane protein [Prolixibacteraceae bacterium]|nr:MAG: outer membrane protein [Prolixibacteraceae bacterium]